MSTTQRSVRESRSAAETEAIAAAWAGDLRAGDVVLLSGELGSGKTTFVRGACRALGVETEVTSPTFTIGRRYAGGRVPVSHLDLYRIADLGDEDPGLLADYVSPDAIAFVEWPGGAEAELASLVGVGVGSGGRLRRVILAHAGGDARRLRIE